MIFVRHDSILYGISEEVVEHLLKEALEVKLTPRRFSMYAQVSYNLKTGEVEKRRHNGGIHHYTAMSELYTWLMNNSENL